jgi:hypothetical protein
MSARQQEENKRASLVIEDFLFDFDDGNGVGNSEELKHSLI